MSTSSPITPHTYLKAHFLSWNSNADSGFSDRSWTNPENRSVEQLIIRSASTLGFWIILYCIIQTYMGSMAFVSVALRFSQVDSWRPGFGPITEAYTVRRFWG